ncbi:family 31 glycosyltransferase [Melampsora larici-populina 98AG31]|uniref:Family 31 glycosyltransferase n=1 Tax=Melampsora larici-populina (strain 98AG31 / pathotype 3-4-7) TaxID=747676 RepID=F4R4M1_MELLP|nr:family 31 glycosyltransferase [Melampsora larici-populina 98AG31]EGG12974.1 family 31 glycosyltransferase [Melampsora larici-populina 98AG31]
METFNDIVILEIPENMNRGKTYAYFRWASENATIPFYYHSTSSGDTNEPLQLEAGDQKPDQKVSVGFRKADFVVKADDDAFIVLRELERHLRVAPRNKTYWGYLIRNLFMGGECYALSSDLVDYVASSASVLNHLTGAEDKKVAKWMRIHPNATSINWVTEKCWIYDHPKAGTTYAHGFLFPDEVRRVREEGKRGLTEAELQLRGYDWPQAYSTVTRWKERYLPPRSRMTMEEEVEDLVEGGGKFNRTDWRSSDIDQKPLVRIDEVLFEANDQRLQLPTILSTLPEDEMRTKGVTEHGAFSSGAHSSSALLSSSAHHEPSIPLKFGRPPSELLTPLPAYEDLPESDFKQALGRVAKDNQRVELNHKENKMIGLPAVRFDEDENRLREIRFEGRKNGGTVVVHYLKRNEWFLETQLVLLGKSYTWDSGLEPMDHITRIEKAAIGTKNKLEVIESGNERFGGARMYGSPLIELDGTIKMGEASKLEEVEEPDLAIRKTIEGGAGWVRGKPRVRVSDLENGPDFSLGKEEEKEDEKEEEKAVVEEETTEIVENSEPLQSHLTSTPLSSSSSSSPSPSSLLPTSLTATVSSDLSRGVDQQIRLPDDQSEILNNRPTLEHHQPQFNLNNTGIDI